MDTGEICKQAIRECHDLPKDVRDRADEIQNVEWSKFDQSYIDFLDEQILLEARGPEWSERLRKRKRNLLALVDMRYLSCKLDGDGHSWTFAIASDPPDMVHHESCTLNTNLSGDS